MIEQLHLPQAETRIEFLNAMKAYLEKVYRGGKFVVVVAEDLDTADDEVIEQIRLLSNLETPDDESLVSILITGNRRLEERLSTYEHRALQQRVEVRRTAEPFTVAETAAYIRHRLMVAGAFLEIFTAEAVERIHRFSGGLPKLIDIVCDHALKRACIEKKRKIDGAMIAGYVKEILATSQIGFNHATDEGGSKSKLTVLPVLTAGFIILIALSLYLFQKGPETYPPAPPPAFSLQFEARSAAISDGDFGKLDAAAEFLIANPKSRAVVTSSPEGASAAAYAKRMASARPEAVKSYLVSKGVGVDRIKIGASRSREAKRMLSREGGGKSRSVKVEIASRLDHLATWAWRPAPPYRQARLFFAGKVFNLDRRGWKAAPTGKCHLAWERAGR